MSAEDWKVGEFNVHVLRGHQSTGYEPVAGWVNGLFALDFRVWDDDEGDPYCPGWQLTHVPAGRSICGILTDLPKAQGIADEIAAEADWDFSTIEEAESRSAALGPAFKRVQARHGSDVVRSAARFTPFTRNAA